MSDADVKANDNKQAEYATHLILNADLETRLRK